MTVMEFFPVLRNVSLPLWPVSTIPSTIFGVRGVEKSRWRVRVAMAYYVKGRLNKLVLGQDPSTAFLPHQTWTHTGDEG